MSSGSICMNGVSHLSQPQWYSFRQNNSGGWFHYSAKRGISEIVYVEAKDADQANERAKKIGTYFSPADDCDCCGPRWIEAYERDRELDQEPIAPPPPSPVTLEQGVYPPVFVHPLDGLFYHADRPNPEYMDWLDDDWFFDLDEEH